MRKHLRRILITLVSIGLLLTGGFYYYVSDYYKADEIALKIVSKQIGIDVQNDHIVLTPTTPSDKALIFYPGAKVEYTSYLPILEKITEQTGMTTILVMMPFNMAIFNANKADDIMDEYPNIKQWYVGGHSMGGAMASSYASKHRDKVEGLILLAAYIYGDYPDNKTLTIYGSLNTSVADKIDYTENIVKIEGGNHAQFGNYGKQKGDDEALITRDEQQDQAVDAIKQFLLKDEQ